MTQRLVGNYFSSVVLGLISIALASPAWAAPVMFAGNIVTENAYNGTIVFPRTAPGAGALSVSGSGPASFTVPSGAFVTPRMYLISTGFTLPGPGFVGSVAAYFSGSNSAGILSPSFWTPSASFYFPANTTVFPGGPSSPRSGYFRLIAGPNGFGGNMPHIFKGSYSVHFTTPPIQHVWFGIRGSGFGAPLPMAVSNPSAIVGNTITVMGLTFSLIAASARAAWLTGTVTAYVPSHSPFVPMQVYTALGVDGRNAPGTSGTISLVTPQVLNSYSTVGTTIVVKENQTASVSTLTVTFLPEPAYLTLLATGFGGLFALSRIRRR